MRVVASFPRKIVCKYKYPNQTEDMESKDETISTLRAELDLMLKTLKLIVDLNSRGKTKQIADEAEAILKSYNR